MCLSTYFHLTGLGFGVSLKIVQVLICIFGFYSWNTASYIVETITRWPKSYFLKKLKPKWFWSLFETALKGVIIGGLFGFILFCLLKLTNAQGGVITSGPLEILNIFYLPAIFLGFIIPIPILPFPIVAYGIIGAAVVLLSRVFQAMLFREKNPCTKDKVTSTILAIVIIFLCLFLLWFRLKSAWFFWFWCRIRIWIKSTDNHLILEELGMNRISVFLFCC